MESVKGRFRGIISFALIYIGIQMVTRTGLLFFSGSEVSWNVWELIKVYFVGGFYDLLSVGYILIPFVLFATFYTDKAFHKRWRIASAYVFYVVMIAAAVFGAFAEYFFWEEFSNRFNFIAIDYLIYTSEVTNNIFESYNIPLVVMLWVLITAVIATLSIKLRLFTPILYKKTSIWSRLKVGGAMLLFPLISFFAFGQNIERYFDNMYNAELAKDGLYSLGSAYINNELEYHKFYKNNSTEKVIADLRKLIATDSTRFTDSGITRMVESNQPEKRYNIILVCEESLSASFFKTFGNDQNITPNLDSLASQSLLFTNVYSTGTRTVRGMEAITLSIPPTPGSSIVRRPGNENLFTLGSVLNEKGYDTKFIYGGYGYFDNMNYFFGNNGFTIVDRSNFTKEEARFANAWGVCDEDLFDKALSEADKSAQMGKPFFQFIMTTSNHRPYTYPSGKIDIPSGSGRDGAVKYTDYSIGRLIKKVKEKSWFSNTLIVIVADHCNNSAGKSTMNIDKYHIPFLIYNPHIVKPAKIDLQCSQIDVAPTIMGLLGWNYESKFFGKNILTMKPEDQRALMGTYQKLGYLKGSSFVLLDVQRDVSFFSYDKASNTLTPASFNQQLQDEAIAYYQGAYELYKSGAMKNTAKTGNATSDK